MKKKDNNDLRSELLMKKQDKSEYTKSEKPKNNNKLDNRKYNLLTFLPLILINQFKFFFNLYFLMLCVTQFFPRLQVGFLITYIGPLAFVIGLTALKEFFDDRARMKRDQMYNDELFRVYGRGRPGGEKNSKKDEVRTLEEGFTWKKSQDLQVGDIVYMEKGERVPCDLLILATKSSDNGIVFIKTDQLDGETDWKERMSCGQIQKVYNQDVSIHDIDFTVEIGEPNNEIYKFRGVSQLSGKNASSSSQEQKSITAETNTQLGLGQAKASDVEILELENTAWSSTTVASGDFYGLVIYVGKHTRIQMNSSTPRIKFPQADFEINYLSKLLFLLCLFLSFMFILIDGFRFGWFVKFVQFLVLLCCIVPQSLRTNLDVAKICYSFRINNDSQIEGTVSRNSQMSEELGRVQYLLSDKTGTLTRNEMIFRKISTKALNYTEDDFPYIFKTLQSLNPINQDDGVNKKQQNLAMLMLSLAVCHNIQPQIDNQNVRFLQSASPDEVALASFAEEMGFFIEFRDREKIQLRVPWKDNDGKIKLNGMGNSGVFTGERPNGKKKILTSDNGIVTFEILKCFTFSSARQRMGIVLRIAGTDSDLGENGKILFFLKGADTMIKKKVSKNGDSIVEEADNLARDGLRTLAFCYKEISVQEYENWNSEYNQALLRGDDDNISNVIDMLESGMNYLGLSGVEDLLQEEVRETIESLREARIRIWILTGDKVETAKCIAKSTGLKAKDEIFYEMLSLDPLEIENQISKLSSKQNTCLVIQGSVVTKIYEMNAQKGFFNSIKNFPAVVFCRCSPTQKAIIAKSLQEFQKAIVCSIGDGGNDVSMIQQANVGVGIEGKEGLQAAMASDFSIKKFKNIKRLLLWHGRKASLCTANITLFVMHRGIMISLIQVFFSLIFYYITVPIYNPFLVLGFSMIYVVFPVFAIVSADDIQEYHAMNYPVLYTVCQGGRQMNTLSFGRMIWKSIYQSAITFLFSITAFNSQFLGIVTITYSILVFVELLNILLMVRIPNLWINSTVFISFALYLVSVFYFRPFLGLVEITGSMWVKIVVITLACWGPFQFFDTMRQRLFPDITDKILKVAVEAKEKPDSDYEGLEDSRMVDTDGLNSIKTTEASKRTSMSKKKNGSMELE